MLGAYATTTNSRNWNGYVQNFKLWDEGLSIRDVRKEYDRYRILYNKLPLEGAYTNALPGPLLYEMNTLSPTNLMGAGHNVNVTTDYIKILSYNSHATT